MPNRCDINYCIALQVRQRSPHTVPTCQKSGLYLFFRVHFRALALRHSPRLLKLRQALELMSTSGLKHVHPRAHLREWLDDVVADDVDFL